MSGSAAITGGAQADGYGQIIINDFHNFSAAGLSGQSGLATATVLVAGSLSTSNNVTSGFDGQASNTWRYTYSDGTGPGAGSALDLYYRVTQNDFDTFSPACAINGAFTACANTFGLFSFDIPFIWGVDDPLGIQFIAHAQAVGVRDFVAASASYDFANSILWGGLSNVRANGMQVTDYDYRSGSGYDWRMSSIAQNPVPEPVTLALVGIGLTGLAASRRRRR